jgi:predicted nucleic acid-binding protein
MQNNCYVVDANVFIKLLIEETDSDNARQFFEHCINQNIVCLVPSIFVYEVMYVSQKKNLDIQKIYSLLQKQLALNIKVVDFDEKTGQKAIDIITASQNEKSGYPSFYDSMYHALAIQNDCDFITADHPHFTKTKHLGSVKYLSEFRY